MTYIKKIAFMLMVTALVFAQSFDDYFRLASEQDPELQATYKTVEIALEKVAQVAALPDPGLSFGYFVSPVETRLGPQQVKVSLTQMFPWFGTLKAQKQAAAMQADAAYQNFLYQKQLLYAELAAAYYPILERSARIQVRQAVLENLLSLRSLTLSKFANGQAGAVKVLRIDRMIESTRTQLHVLEDKKKPLEAAFNAMLDRDPGTAVDGSGDLAQGLGSNVDAYDSLFTSSHPLLSSFDLRVRAKDLDEKAARKAGLPKFGLGIDYVAVGDRTDMVVAESGRDVIMPMLSISLPLARGKYKAAVKTVRLERERLELQRDAKANDLRTAYENASFDLRSRYADLESVRQEIALSEQIRDLLLTQYAQDGGGLEELLDIWRDLLNYEEKRVTLMSRIHMLKAKLLALTAGVTL